MSVTVFAVECAIFAVAFGVLVFGMLINPALSSIIRPKKWSHVKVMLPVEPVFAVGGVIIAAVMVWIW